MAMAMVIASGSAVYAHESSKGDVVTVSAVQTEKDNGYDGEAALRCGILFNIRIPGITKIEIESVDGYALAGTADIIEEAYGEPVAGNVKNGSTIITFNASSKEGLISGKDYYISTLPCDLYGGYRLSIYRDGLVAHYFGVHQSITPGIFITPDDLIESELEFDDPDAPLVEEGRPKMDSRTHELFIRYRRNPTEANRQALLERMGVRYDKVVDEMVQNRDTRIQQQFLRFIDPRRDENPNDEWMVLRGASARDAYIGYAPVTTAEYAVFDSGFSYAKGNGSYPAVNISIDDAKAYCEWLTAQDPKHIYRLPSEEEWILAAGHMPKDVAMNSGHIEPGLTSVNAYKQSTGACGGIDFWGNCWEWTSSTDMDGLYVVKGGSWDSSRDDCRSEKSDVVRDGSLGYANVGFRVVRTDRQ